MKDFKVIPLTYEEKRKLMENIKRMEAENQGLYSEIKKFIDVEERRTR